MAALRVLVVFVACLLALVFCAPTPGGDSKHVKYIIHVPVKYHTIHHVKVEKVPIHVKKHIHHHKHHDEHKDHDEHIEHHDGGYDRLDDQFDFSDLSFLDVHH